MDELETLRRENAGLKQANLQLRLQMLQHTNSMAHMQLQLAPMQEQQLKSELARLQQQAHDAAVDRRDAPSGANHAPRDDAAPNNG